MSANLDEPTPRLTVDLTQVLADVPSRLARIEADVAHMKGDLGKLETGQKELRGELKSEVAGLRGELKSEVGGLRAEVAGIRLEMRWLTGIVLVGFGSLVAKAFHWLG
jgi:hypothetical protein